MCKFQLIQNVTENNKVNHRRFWSRYWVRQPFFCEVHAKQLGAASQGKQWNVPHSYHFEMYLQTNNQRPPKIKQNFLYFHIFLHMILISYINFAFNSIFGELSSLPTNSKYTFQSLYFHLVNFSTFFSLIFHIGCFCHPISKWPTSFSLFGSSD